MREMWISFYMQDGRQSGITLQVSGDIDTYTEAERMLQYIYGEDFGGIADYGFYDEE